MPEPTATDEPTSTTEPKPTATEEPTPTSTPEGLLFRDDFNGELAPGWRWENENSDNVSFSDDGWLVIVAEDQYQSEEEFPFTNMLLRDLPPGEVVVTLHLEADPDTNFKQASLMLWQDETTHVVVNRGFCAPCGGSGFYFDYIVPGLEPNSYQLPGFENTDVYLRIEIAAETISMYYALEPDQWERLGQFGNFFEFTQVAIGTSNIDPAGVDDDLTARFDWFEITYPQ